MMLKIVPRPGVCFKNIQKNKTIELITAVDKPIDKSVFIETPCANTVHGLTPTPAAINKASPNPKMINPMIRNANDNIGGLTVSVLGELQNKLGIVLIVRMSNFMAIKFVCKDKPKLSHFSRYCKIKLTDDVGTQPLLGPPLQLNLYY